MKTFISRRWKGASVVQEKKIKAKDKAEAERQFRKDKKLDKPTTTWVGDYFHVYDN